MRLEWLRGYLAFVRSFAPYLFLSLYIYSAPRTGALTFGNLSLIFFAGYVEVCFQVVDFLRSGLRWFGALVALMVGFILPLNIVIPVMTTVMLFCGFYGSAITIIKWLEIAGDFIVGLLDLGAAGRVKLEKTWASLKTMAPGTGFGPTVIMAAASAEHRPPAAAGFVQQRDTSSSADDDADGDHHADSGDLDLDQTHRPRQNLGWVEILKKIDALELRLDDLRGRAP